VGRMPHLRVADVLVDREQAMLHREQASLSPATDACRCCSGWTATGSSCRSVWTPPPHICTTAHRGARSWERAVVGIRIAQSEGFRVRVAAAAAQWFPCA
jgi:hypothetical protein